MVINIGKKTPARLAIIKFLENSKLPVDAEEILQMLRIKNLDTNKVTVYRNLDYFLKKGIIDRVEFGEGKYRYEIKINHHHHLICTNCGKVEDVDGEVLKKIEEEFYQNKKFLVKNHSLEFFGLCANCQK